MHPQFRIDQLQQHQRELERSLTRTRLLAEAKAPRPVREDALALRLCRPADDPALERLAALEGRPSVPDGRHLVALVNGELVASLPLVTGDVLADPFRPTAYLLPLLKARAAQLDDQPRRIDTAKAIAARMLHTAR
jgi:hypothetical protein